MTKKYIQKLLAAVIISAIITTISLYSGMLYWYWQFFIVSLLYFTAGFCFKLKKEGWISLPFYSIIMILPFLLIYSVFTINKELYNVYPIALTPLISFVFGVILNIKLKRKSMRILSFASSILLFLLLAFVGMPNYLNYLAIEFRVEQKAFPRMQFIDKDLKKVGLHKLEADIIVLDIWTTYCSSCFRRFSDYNNLYLQYKDDARVKVYAVNLKEGRQSIEEVMEVVNDLNYSFPFLYTNDSVARVLKKDLFVTSVPKLIILDKNRKIVYQGRLITDKKQFIGNAYSIIDKLLKD